MTDNGQIVWEDPPRINRSNQSHNEGVWLPLLEPLMEQVGRWARIREMAAGSARTTAQHLRTGRTQRPPGAWEFVTRVSKPGRAYVYARYLGPEDES